MGKRLRSGSALGAAMLLLLASASATARAQAPADVVAAFALWNTTSAAFAPMPSARLLGGSGGSALALRYGRLDFGEIAVNHFALGLAGPLQTGGWRLTAGMSKPDCEGCDANLLLGAGGDLRLAAAPVGTAGTSSLVMGLDGEVGVAFPENLFLFSATVGVPLALTTRTATGLVIAPFVTPAAGVGHSNPEAGDSQTGARFLLGAGLALQGARLGGSAGLQRVFIRDGETTLGVNLTLRF